MHYETVRYTFSIRNRVPHRSAERVPAAIATPIPGVRSSTHTHTRGNVLAHVVVVRASCTLSSRFRSSRECKIITGKKKYRPASSLYYFSNWFFSGQNYYTGITREPHARIVLVIFVKFCQQYKCCLIVATDSPGTNALFLFLKIAVGNNIEFDCFRRVFTIAPATYKLQTIPGTDWP